MNSSPRLLPLLSLSLVHSLKAILPSTPCKVESTPVSSKILSNDYHCQVIVYKPSLIKWTEGNRTLFLQEFVTTGTKHQTFLLSAPYYLVWFPRSLCPASYFKTLPCSLDVGFCRFLLF